MFIFTDQSGCYPVRSTAGNIYLLVLYDYDSNYSHVYTIPSLTGYLILLVYQHTYTFLVSRGLRPQLQRLNNEDSHVLDHNLEDENVNVQLAPPSVHLIHTAERAIHSLKNPFIVIMCGTNPSFNLALWYTLTHPHPKPTSPSSDQDQMQMQIWY